MKVKKVEILSKNIKRKKINKSKSIWSFLEPFFKDKPEIATVFCSNEANSLEEYLLVLNSIKSFVEKENASDVLIFSAIYDEKSYSIKDPWIEYSVLETEKEAIKRYEKDLKLKEKIKIEKEKKKRKQEEYEKKVYQKLKEKYGL